MSQERRHQADKIRVDLTDENIPPKNTTRWVKSRKLAVIRAIKSGYYTAEEACAYYELSMEELESWKRMLENHGPDALRTTHLRRYRNKDIERGSPYTEA